jgi:hypothetical protein
VLLVDVAALEGEVRKTVGPEYADARWRDFRAELERVNGGAT